MQEIPGATKLAKVFIGQLNRYGARSHRAETGTIYISFPHNYGIGKIRISNHPAPKVLAPWDRRPRRFRYSVRLDIAEAPPTVKTGCGHTYTEYSMAGYQELLSALVKKCKKAQRPERIMMR